jgi:hypothetical protein
VRGSRLYSEPLLHHLKHIAPFQLQVTLTSPTGDRRAPTSGGLGFSALGLVPSGAVVPSPLPLCAAICRLLQGLRHNILLFLSVFLIGLIAVLRERE